MKVSEFQKLEAIRLLYFACDCFGGGKVMRAGKLLIASVSNKEVVQKRVWLTREAALAAALKLSNEKIMQLRKELAENKLKNMK